MEFLDLLYAGAPESAFDAVVEASGASGEELEELRRRRDIAVRLREQMERQQSREAQLTALYETANDLIAIRDVDTILAAIVRRARQLLNADMTYLSLNDEAEGASFMKVTDGSISAEFRNLRLPLGTGLLGLVAQTGAPYHTDDYQHDARFKHREYIDHAVDDEGIRAILGVPLIVEGTVIGALLATHRTVRAFPPHEVTLLTSFAAHAAVALENARLFAALDATNQQLARQTSAVSAAAAAHDRLTSVLLEGGGLDDLAGALGEVLGGEVTVHDVDGRPIAGSASLDGLEAAVGEAARSGRAVDAMDGTWVAAALAGAEHLGSLVLRDVDAPLELSARRTLERGAMVTALLMLFSRSVADAEDRLRGDLLADLLAGRGLDRPRARGLGGQELDLERDAVVLVAATSSDRAGDRRRVTQAVAAWAGEHDGLGGMHDERAVAVVAAEGDPVALGEALAARLATVDPGPVTVGVAAAEAGAAAVADAGRRASGVLRTLLTLGRVGETSDEAGLGLARLLLGHNGREELAAFVRTTIGPVLDYDARRGTDLAGTLEAWFATGGSPAATARRLHVHTNTVTQRLDRVGTLLGEGWRDPARALEQQLALQMWRLTT